MKKQTVDIERLHALFMAEKSLKEIAAELGIKPGTAKTMISAERRKDPFKWPARIERKSSPKAADESAVWMHLFECREASCFTLFSVEDYPDTNLEETVCPQCLGSQHLHKVGYGYFTKTKSFPDTLAG